MQLVLMRHARAVAPESWSRGDEERPLSDEGRSEIERAGAGLAASGIAFDLIVTSPFTRAVETATRVALATRYHGTIEECPALAPGLRLADLESFLSGYPDIARLLLVGHAPDMANLALGLIGCHTGRGLQFSSGTACCMDLDAFPPRHPGTLVWVLTPALMQALGPGR